mgnify:CR=1 FL=1
MSTPPTITVDLYGNVFKDGQNTNSQIGDFARNNPDLAPQVDGAIRQLVIDARTYITEQIAAAVSAKDAEIAELKAKLAAAIAPVEAVKTPATPAL